MSVRSDYVIDEGVTAGVRWFTPACTCGWRGHKTAFGAEQHAALHALYAEQEPTLAAQHIDRVAAERAAEQAEATRIWAKPAHARSPHVSRSEDSRPAEGEAA